MIKDFTVLFQHLWYRDFPMSALVQGKMDEKFGAASWTTHIAGCVKGVGDLMGYLTHFEHAGRFDAVIKDFDQNCGERAITHLEWEWKQPAMLGERFNEVEKLVAARGRALFSTLITYSRHEKDADNRSIIERQWGDGPEPLLVQFVTFTYKNGRRHLGQLSAELFVNGKWRTLRVQEALPWNRPGSKWFNPEEPSA
ncbi:hypothetical protein OR16_41636 [Cupriavidus basilensis OR16]|uniref:Uncharacterized protein n=1 Tax=Cupriavidus basilensis OR16 TaxID=1127483 RepID=H1SIK3_9BURK|nr:hypothetical protein OR16_41636 [Cupriavidus basilensis OR16]